MKGAYFNLLIMLVTFTDIADSVPHEYCLQPFNDGDCDKPPVPVFYYYKPGSRCEIRMWRGCPTMNKFPDEFLCSHYCIGRLWGRTDEKEETGTLEHHEDIYNPDELIEELSHLDVPEMEEINNILDEVIEEVQPFEKLSFVRPTESEINVTTVTTEAALEDTPELPPDTPATEAVTEEATTPEAVTEEPSTEAPTPSEAPTPTEAITEAPATTPEGEDGDADEVITT